MARTKTISNEQILDAARSLFLERGLAATTAEIARQAGISEGTIFKRFATKDDLFRCAMGLPSEPPWTAQLANRVGRGDLRQNLDEICEEVLSFFLELVPKAILLISCRITPSDVFGSQDEPAPVRGIRAMTRFFEEEQRLGRVRPCDAEVLARTLLGAIHHYAFAEASNLNARMPLPKARFLKGVVDILLEGVLPPVESAAR